MAASASEEHDIAAQIVEALNALFRGWRAGETWGVAGGRVTASRRNRAPEYALAERLEKVDSRHAHGEVSTGEPVGREAW